VQDVSPTVLSLVLLYNGRVHGSVFLDRRILHAFRWCNNFIRVTQCTYLHWALPIEVVYRFWSFYALFVQNV